MGKLVSEESIVPDDKIWSILLYLLNDHNTGSDLVVRFTSAVAVGECIDVSIHYLMKWDLLETNYN